MGLRSPLDSSSRWCCSWRPRIGIPRATSLASSRSFSPPWWSGQWSSVSRSVHGAVQSSRFVGGAAFLLVAGLYVVFVPPIDYAECEQLFLELSNDPCGEHSDLGWAVFFLVGAMCGGALSLSVSGPRPRGSPGR